MQASYTKKYSATEWDSLNLEYPVKKFPSTDESSKTIGHKWRNQPEVLRDSKPKICEATAHTTDNNVFKELSRSQTSVDYDFKLPITERFNKHTAYTENQHIYPLLRRISERPPQSRVHGTTEMRSSYGNPTIASRLITDKNQYKHPTMLNDTDNQDRTCNKELPTFDTTHDGFEKYLDPYLTTSRLHFRPYTEQQLSNQSASKDILTYYTYANIPWTRTRGPNTDQRQLPLSRAEPIYDKEKFKEGFREIRVANKPKWIPGSFRTETRDNYKQQYDQPEAKIPSYESFVSVYQTKETNKLSIPHPIEHESVQNTYFTENKHCGTGKPICSVIDQFKEKNKRLEKNMSRTV